MGVLEIAQAQLGVKEATKSNDGEPSVRYMGGRKEPWCGHFVAWVYRQAGKPIPGDVVPTTKRANPLASVAFLERVFKEHEWYYREPKPGDLVFYKDRGQSDPGKGRHVGLVVLVDAQNRSFSTIEGNWGDCVASRTLRFDDPRVCGFGRMP